MNEHFMFVFVHLPTVATTVLPNLKTGEHFGKYGSNACFKVTKYGSLRINTVFYGQQYGNYLGGFLTAHFDTSEPSKLTKCDIF